MPRKRRINYDKVKELHLKGYSQTKIAEKLGCWQAYISLVLKELGLKANYKDNFHKPSDKLVYSDYKLKGLTIKELSQKYGITEYFIQVKIGRHLMNLCRQEKECPFKALLPEYTVE